MSEFMVSIDGSDNWVEFNYVNLDNDLRFAVRTNDNETAYETINEAYSHVNDFLVTQNGLAVLERGNLSSLFGTCPRALQHFEYMQHVIRPQRGDTLPYYATDMRLMWGRIRLHDGTNTVIIDGESTEETLEGLDQLIDKLGQLQPSTSSLFLDFSTIDEYEVEDELNEQYENYYQVTVQRIEDAKWVFEMKYERKMLVPDSDPETLNSDEVLFLWDDFEYDKKTLIDFLFHARTTLYHAIQ